MSEPHIDSPRELDDSDARPVDRAAPTGRRRAESPPSWEYDENVVLEVDRVTLRFGGVVALNEVSFRIRKGEIFGLIGPNGAGKTTCFNAMTGVYRPTSGGIRFQGRSIVGKKKHEITRVGIARTFQNIRLFPEMTALENVMVGADAHHKTSVLGALFRLPRHWREERTGRERSLELLRFVGIERRAGEVSRNLSYGEQRRLEIARALATEPDAAVPGRAGGGLQPGGEGGSARADPQDQRHRGDGAADRARHAAGDGRRPTGSWCWSSARRSPRARPPRCGTTRRSSPRTWGCRPMLLELDNVTLLYGRIQALHGISLTVGEGEIVALIGANGAGKSTTMRAISGLRPVPQGSIRFDGQDITKLRADLRVIRGRLAVAGGPGHLPGHDGAGEPGDGRVHPHATRAEINRGPGAGVRAVPPPEGAARSRSAAPCRGGEQQMLAVGRALMSRPKLLLLDEPSMGLAPMLIQQIFDIVVEINQQGTTVLLVEQNAQQALSRAHRGVRPGDRPDRRSPAPARSCCTTRRSRTPTSASLNTSHHQGVDMFRTTTPRRRAILGLAVVAALTMSVAACGEESSGTSSDSAAPAASASASVDTCAGRRRSRPTSRRPGS